MDIVIKSESDVDLRHTVLSHGWVNLAPWDWDDKKAVLSRDERPPSGQMVRIEVSQQTKKDKIARIAHPDGVVPDNGFVEKAVRRWLSIDWRPEPAISVAKKISPKVARYIRKGGGRFLRGSTFYEDFVKTVCTMNASWGFTKKIVNRIVGNIGEGVFPSPIQLLDAGQEFLVKNIRMGYRSKVLIGATEKLLEEGLIDENGNCREDKLSYDKLKALWGIGQYAAGHLMVLLQDFGRIPIDSEVIKYCGDHYGIKPDEIPDFFSEWGEYSFLGYKLSRIISRDNWIG